MNANLSRECTSLRYESGKLTLLDQQKLPHTEDWLEIPNVPEAVDAIKLLKVRGAPAIGVSAALALAVSAKQGTSKDQLFKEAEALRNARPTAVNLMNAIDRMRLVLEASENPGDDLEKAALELFDEDVELCQKMGEFGLKEAPDNAKILTHCNTGGLATVGIGTALSVVIKAHEAGKKPTVWVDETRPLLQGGRLTAWELQQNGIPYQIICDNMAGALMAKGEVDCIFVGADRIARNGDFANKTGTYGLAVLAKHHGVPFYTVAPWTTLDLNCPSGKEIEIEQRKAEEVRGYVGMIDGKLSQVAWAPENSPVYNPSFDVTPAELLTGMITDRGIFTPEDLGEGALVTN